MSKLDTLIQELCPNGVEYKRLDTCCNILDKQRKPISKGARVSGNYPYYGANGIQDYVDSYIFDGTFVLVGEDGSVITEKGNPVVNWATGKIWVNNHAHIIAEKEGLILRYLYHYLQVVDISLLVHGNIPKLTQGDFKELLIPVPPIEVQEEIVRILDNFTELTVELTVELTARKKQYEYYRDELLTFDDNIPRVKISEVAKVSRGIRVTKSQLNDSNKYPVYQNSLVPLGYYDKPNCFANTPFIISAGAAGEIGFSSVEYWAADDCLYFTVQPKLNNKFLYYALMTNVGYIKSRVRKASIPRLSRNVIDNLVIPLPPLDEQQRIVSILDRFDALCNDISVGLPAEIEARKKQYEYYRNRLLTFKRLRAEAEGLCEGKDRNAV